jgi:anti-anti-sigma factor
MQAIIANANEGDVVIVRLCGRLDIEAAQNFREACVSYLTDKKVVFNFRELSFVGSSGIVPFLEAMQRLGLLSKSGFKFCLVGSEFRKVFAASPLGHIEIYESEMAATAAFSNPQLAHAAVHPVPVNNSGYGLLSLEVDPADAARSDKEERERLAMLSQSIANSSLDANSEANLELDSDDEGLISDKSKDLGI